MEEIKFGKLKVNQEVKFGRLKVDVVITGKIEDVEIKEHSLDGTNLVIELSNNQTLIIDISEYIGTTELTQEQINAINNMNVSIENGEIILEYDDKVLDINFSLEDKNLIVDDNLNGADFNINENGEMEVLY